MNMFAVLDALKNIKASVKNDFSTYRRAGQFLTRFSDIRQQEESQTLSLFLASHDKITEDLKTKLAVISNYDELIIDIITTCINYYENKRYLVPDDKHMYLKVIGFGLRNVSKFMLKLDHSLTIWSMNLKTIKVCWIIRVNLIRYRFMR